MRHGWGLLAGRAGVGVLLVVAEQALADRERAGDGSFCCPMLCVWGSGCDNSQLLPAMLHLCHSPPAPCLFSLCSYAIKKKDEIERVAKANR